MKRMIKTSWPVTLANGSRLEKGEHIIEDRAVLKLALLAKGVSDVTDDVLARNRAALKKAIDVIEGLTGEVAVPRDDKALADAVQRLGLAEERLRHIERAFSQSQEELRQANEAKGMIAREFELLRVGSADEARGLTARIQELEAAFSGHEGERIRLAEQVAILKAEVAASEMANQTLQGEIERLRKLEAKAAPVVEGAIG